MQLLKPKQVAEKLGLSVATVYEKSHVLGGFYPFGIKSLRFDEDFIDGVLERQKAQALVLPIPSQQKELQRQRVSNQKGSATGTYFASGKSEERGQTFLPNRHNLFRCG